MLRNSPTSYGWVSVMLHWGMAVVIFILFGMGVWMKQLDYYDVWYHRAPDLHQSIGVLLLVLLLLRIVWIGVNVKPDISGVRWERLTAAMVHWLHYLLMLVLCLSGYLIPTAEGEGFELFGLLHIPSLFALTAQQADVNGAIHLYAAWAIMVLSAVHIVAALKHHFVDRDTTLLRMLGMARNTGGERK